jgi:hypothetical protein
MSNCKQLYVNLGGSGGGSLPSGSLQVDGGVPLDTTLRNVEDQAGTNSPLQLSTITTAIAAPSSTFSSGTNIRSYLDLSYTINTTGGTNTISGLNINVNNTSLTGTTSLPFRIQRAGTTTLSIQQNNTLASMGINTTPSFDYPLFVTGGTTNRILSGGGFNVGGFNIIFNSSGLDFSPTNNDMALNSGTGNITITGTRIRLSGTTSAFPAFKRNGVTVEFRLADDSGYANIDANRYFTSGSQGQTGSFLTADAKTITVTNGLITAIV